MIAINPDKLNSKELFELVARAKAKHNFKTIIIHWTGSDYDSVSPDYHLNIGQDGSVYKTCWSFNEIKPHTVNKNKDTIGIALDCGLGAEYKSMNKIFFGTCPPTSLQILSLVWLVAGICFYMGIDINSRTVKTHFELAVSEGYGPSSDAEQSRWDLAKMPDTAIPREIAKEAGLSKSSLGGTIIRDLATYCYQKLVSKNRKEVCISRGERDFLQTQLAF